MATAEMSEADGFEELELAEAVRQSIVDGNLPPGPQFAPEDPAVTVYTLSRVEVEIRPTAGRDSRLPGRLSLLQQRETVFLNWVPHTVKSREQLGRHGSTNTKANLYTVNYPWLELRSIHRKGNRLIIMHNSGITLPPFVFDSMATADNLLSFMRTNLGLIASPQDDHTFLVQPPAELQRALEGLGLPQRTPSDEFAFNTLEAFSRITRVFRQLPTLVARPNQVTIDDDLDDHVHKLPAEVQEQNEAARRSAEAAATAAEGSMQVRATTDAGDLGAFNVIESMASAPRRPVCSRSAPVSLTQWRSFFSSETGMVLDEPALRAAVFAGGLEMDARREAWPFLLGYSYPYREILPEQRAAKERTYHVMKLQWQSVSEDQLTRFSALREMLTGVAKDVPRTDRDLSFFEGEANLDILRDILCTYGMYNFDLGYVQGMSDLCSVIFHVIGDEVDSFWCFAGLMDRMHKNFALDQSGMNKHLRELALLVRFLDPELMDHFERTGSAEMYFAFRWLLVFFKREFPFSDIMPLWEVMWSNNFTNRHHLFIALAILDMHRAEILTNIESFDSMIKFVNDLSGQLNLRAVMETAEALYMQFSNSVDIPDLLTELTTRQPPPPHAEGHAAAAAPGEGSWVDISTISS